MIKETQIRSFINLINKISTTQKSKKSLSILQNSRFHTQDMPKYQSITNDESLRSKSKKYQKILNKYRKSQSQSRECYSEHFLQNFSCPSKDFNKKNAFEIYRESLEKRKQYQSSLLFKKQKDGDIEENSFLQRQNNHLKKIIFPCNRSKNYKKPKIGEKVEKKKIIYNSPFSIKTIANHDSFIKYKKENLTNNNLLDKFLSDTDRRDINLPEQFQKMHLQKLNYKPVFRVKKLNTQSFLEDSENCIIKKSGTMQQEQSWQKKLSSRKTNKLKTEQCQIAQQKKLGPLYICKNQKHLKSKRLIIDAEQLEGWKHDHNEYISDYF